MRDAAQALAITRGFIVSPWLVRWLVRFGLADVVLVLVLVLAPALAGCPPPYAQSAAPTVSLRVHGAPADATVVIDDNALGTFDFVAAHGVALPPGVHRVSVTASGYFPWDRVVEAKPGSPMIRLDVVLVPIPD